MTAVLAPAAFDVGGPLPTGTTVLEASAGTGKTFTIAALAARYVAEGVATLPELMLVTFGREATTELRERVRARLLSTQRALADPVAARVGADRVHALLADVPPHEVALRRARLTRALATFDAATIATTHQFCSQMLAGLGVAGDADQDAVFVESIDDMVTEVVDDFYVRKYGDRSAGPPPFTRGEALQLARAAVHDGQALLAPHDAEPGSVASTRFRFASAVRTEVARRKRERRTYTYDDMLTRLDDALACSPSAAERLRTRYRVVLVDEFQDTDPVQWSILRRTFHGHTALVLIGDPKQAIYAFRGADVVTYLDATRAADHHATLAVNHRSDAPLLRALQTVFSGAALGDERIVVHPVEAAWEGSRLVGAPVDAPVRVRVAARVGLPTPPRRELAIVGPARELVARDLAADVAALLNSAATIDGAPVRPGDVAVLVRTNDQGGMVRAALAAVGVPAVVTGTASVFGTPVALDWLTLLDALEQPRLVRLRAVALTGFLGHTVAQLCGPQAEALLDEIGAKIRGWAAVLHERGVAALLEAVSTDTALPARLLARTDGERWLTDLRHVAQALHAAAVEGHLGPAALVEWLRRRIDEAAVDTGAERSRRLESDAAAVQIITIHRSKGLEFPIVYVPFGWDRNVRDPEVPLFHVGQDRVRDVGGESGEGWRDRCAAHRAEEAGEDLRLLYVALTRAKCQVVTWWVPSTTTATSPLHRLLIGRPSAGTEPAASYRVPSDQAVRDALRALASPDLAVEEVPPESIAEIVGASQGPQAGVSSARYIPPPTPPGELAAAELDRTLDRQWRRTSYSSLTAGASHHAGGVTSEPEAPGTQDEPEPPPDEDVAGIPPGAIPPGTVPAAAPASPMADLPMGTGFGTLVHAVLETADLTASDLAGELTARCLEQLIRQPLAGVDALALVNGLLPVARTPLGPIGGGLTLADIAPADRLAELEFELPLGGGDRPGPTTALLGELAPLLRAHLAPDDPLVDYPELLAAPALAEQPLRGYLTGSVDAVLRLPGPRFVVVDYKTNWLGTFGPDGREPLTADHYTPQRMRAAMIDAHYPLQALLYGVALHRFLRWRLPGYDPARHLGGSLYLFVRGMCGRDTPVIDGTTCGVFGWAPPPALTVALSRLLHEGAS
ncbi:MAG TPA: UvrD-helicase domain-containing protein [Pseudonocardia sp.]